MIRGNSDTKLSARELKEKLDAAKKNSEYVAQNASKIVAAKQKQIRSDALRKHREAAKQMPPLPLKIFGGKVTIPYMFHQQHHYIAVAFTESYRHGPGYVFDKNGDLMAFDLTPEQRFRLITECGEPLKD